MGFLVYSLSMRLTNLLNEKQRRVGKWNDNVSPVAEWLAGKQEMLSSLSEPGSLDLDTARKQKNEVAVRRVLWLSFSN